MTLFELARELFTYLVRFREKASSTAAPPLPEVRLDLLGIFTRMENQAKRDPLLVEPYHQIHYALVALTDEVVLTSGWEHTPAWRQALLEERFYSTQQAGRRFFELAKNLDQAPQDVVAIFYLCLALGFSGRYAPADPELAEVKDSLLARLPSKPRIMEEPANPKKQQDRQVRGWLWSAAAAAALVAVIAFGWPQWQKHLESKPSPAAGPSAQSEPKTATAKPAPPAQPGKQIKVVADQSGSQPAQPPKALPTPPAPAQAMPSDAAKVPAGAEKPAVPAAPKTVSQAQAPAKPAEAAAPGQSGQSAAAKAAPPAAAKTIQPTPAAAPGKKTYRVRMGVYVGPIQSGRFADKLKSAGYQAMVEKLERPNGKTLYVVSITPLASLADAEKIQAEVKEKFKVQGVIKEN